MDNVFHNHFMLMVTSNSDCIDGSDELSTDIKSERSSMCSSEVNHQFRCDDIKCDSTLHLDKFLSIGSRNILESMYSIKDKSVSEDCWSAFKCFSQFSIQTEFFVMIFVEQSMCRIIKNTCPDMFYFQMFQFYLDIFI